MAHEEETNKSPEELRDRVWELADKIKFCMFTSWDGKEQWMRPLTANVERENGAIHFLVSATGGKNNDIERFPIVTLGFVDSGKHDYVTLSGPASLSNDRAKIKDLWSEFDKAWWDGPEDPDIRLITVRPEKAELWDGPNRVIAGAIMLTAALTGAKPPVGDHAKVSV